MKISHRLLLAILPIAFTATLCADEKQPKQLTPEDQQTLEIIRAHQPSRLKQLPADFNERHGATHSDGKYHFTDKPFLIEGADRILSLGTKLGKFWFALDAAPKFYSFNSNWPSCKNLIDLAKTEYFEAVWKMPFKTILLTATTPSEEGWRKPNQPQAFWDKISQDYYDLAAFFYEKFRDRPVTVVLQNWEGDWMLRGIGKDWNPPPEDWQQRCERMQQWIKAKQDGVNRARREFADKSKCKVALAVEVNRVADAWKGIPTVTRNVLPGVEVDLVSYSAYDGINQGDPVRFWKCIDEIRSYAKTGPLFGPGAVMIGEYGVAENDTSKAKSVTERCDEMMGVILAKNVIFSSWWELYCNEFKDKKSPPPVPVKDSSVMRGFYLVKPEGPLSESGQYFQQQWARGNGSTTPATNSPVQ